VSAPVADTVPLLASCGAVSVSAPVEDSVPVLVTCKFWLLVMVATVEPVACWNCSAPAIEAVPLPVTCREFGVEPAENPCSTTVKPLGMLSAVRLPLPPV